MPQPPDDQHLAELDLHALGARAGQVNADGMRHDMGDEGWAIVRRIATTGDVPEDIRFAVLEMFDEGVVERDPRGVLAGLRPGDGGGARPVNRRAR